MKNIRVGPDTAVEIDRPFSVLQRHESEAAVLVSVLVLLAKLLIAWLTYFSGRRVKREGAGT